MLVSPSLGGILSHDSVSYGGVKRPVDLLKVYDGPARMSLYEHGSSEDREELQRYFGDLYGVFMKKFSNFIVDDMFADEDVLTIQAMLQEIIKVKKILLN